MQLLQLEHLQWHVRDLRYVWSSLCRALRNEQWCISLLVINILCCVFLPFLVKGWGCSSHEILGSRRMNSQWWYCTTIAPPIVYCNSIAWKQNKVVAVEGRSYCPPSTFFRTRIKLLDSRLNRKISPLYCTVHITISWAQGRVIFWLKLGRLWCSQKQSETSKSRRVFFRALNISFVSILWESTLLLRLWRDPTVWAAANHDTVLRLSRPSSPSSIRRTYLPFTLFSYIYYFKS